jgi:hypothetical protein
VTEVFKKKDIIHYKHGIQTEEVIWKTPVSKTVQKDSVPDEAFSRKLMYVTNKLFFKKKNLGELKF